MEHPRLGKAMRQAKPDDVLALIPAAQIVRDFAQSGDGGATALLPGSQQ